MSPKLAIVGTGPSSYYLGILLSHKGWSVTIFDPKTPLESPQGAAFFARSLAELPYLEDFSAPISLAKMKVYSTENREAVLEWNTPLSLGLRADIQGYLQRSAVRLGIGTVSSKLASIERVKESWLLKTKDGDEEADFLVGGDGSAAFLRKLLGLKVSEEEMTLEVSTICPMPEGFEHTGVIKFLKKNQSCFWAFPSEGKMQVRFCATGRLLHARDLFSEMDGIVQGIFKTAVPETAPRSVAHLSDFSRFPADHIMGEGWALMSDPAGFINPLSRCGLYFGLKSAALLAVSFGGKVLDQTGYWERLQDEILTPLALTKKKYESYRCSLMSSSSLNRVIARAEKNLEDQKTLLGFVVSELIT